MFASDEYQLLDFGIGRKLERFGPYVVDRPSPAAGFAKPRTARTHGSRRTPALSVEAGARGRWTFGSQVAAAWPIQLGPMTLGLKFRTTARLGCSPSRRPIGIGLPSGSWPPIGPSRC